MESFIWEKKNSFQSLKRNSPLCFFKFANITNTQQCTQREKNPGKNPVIFKSLCLIIFFIRTKNLILFCIRFIWSHLDEIKWIPNPTLKSSQRQI